MTLIMLLALSAAVFQVFFHSALFHRDALLVYSPLKQSLAAAVRAGHFPLWDPGQYLGAPRLGAVENGMLYPFNLIYLLLPLGPAHNLFTLIHYPIAAFTMFLLLGRFDPGTRVRLWGALVFALCGYLVSMHCNVIFITGLAWCPLALYFMDRALAEGARFAGLAGAVIALAVLAGAPQDALITAAIAGAWVFARGSSSAGTRRALGLLAAAAVASIVLSLIQLVPALEYTRLSYRGPGLSFRIATNYSLGPENLVGFLFPAPFGRFWPETDFWGGQFTYSPDGTPWAESLYFGLAPLTLAAIGIFRSRRPRKIMLLAGLLLFLIMSFGKFTPVFGWLYSLIPPLRLFRFPVKYLAYFCGLLAAASALGAGALLNEWRESPARAKKAGAVYSAITIALGTTYLLLWPWLLASGGKDLSPEMFASARAHLFIDAARWMGINLTMGLLAIAAGAGKLPLSRLKWLALLLLAADLYFANAALMPAGPAGMWKRPSAAAQTIAPDGPEPGKYRVYRALPLRPEAGTGDVSQKPLVREALWLIDSLAPNLDALHGFEDLSGYGPLKPRTGFEIIQNPNFRQLEIYNVAWLLVRPELKIPAAVAASERIDQANGFKIVHLENALPRAYFASHAATVPDREAALRAMSSIQPLARIVLTGAQTPPNQGEPVILPAAVHRYEPDRVEVEVDAPSAGWLVLSDRDYPGWRATVDGKPAAIETANLMVRAVRVEKGRHEVVFEYKPRWWWPCLTISLAGWLTLPLWFYFSARRPAV